jgi:hypothetical protein
MGELSDMMDDYTASPLAQTFPPGLTMLTTALHLTPASTTTPPPALTTEWTVVRWRPQAVTKENTLLPIFVLFIPAVNFDPVYFYEISGIRHILLTFSHSSR